MENQKYWGLGKNTYLMLMHLSQLTSFVVPLGGVILPTVMWATNKEKCEDVDNHGKAILNWIISFIIYSVVCIPLMFFIVGIFGLMVLALLNLIFAIIGAVKANEGKIWLYPISIKFFDVRSA